MIYFRRMNINVLYWLSLVGERLKNVTASLPVLFVSAVEDYEQRTEIELMFLLNILIFLTVRKNAYTYFK